MALWGGLGAAARRYLERARDLEWQQERRLLEAYLRGRAQRRRGRKRRYREQERRLLGTRGRLQTRILLATDGSEDAALAARVAADLSDRARARLHVVHVWHGQRPATLPAAASPSTRGRIRSGSGKPECCWRSRRNACGAQGGQWRAPT